MSELLRRIFLHDLARKLLALLFALVLFDLLDAKVQGSDRLTVQLAYVDADQLAQLTESSEQGSKLLVVERADPAAPLVVADRPRPDFLTLHLKGPKDALDRIKARRRTLLLRLGKEGVLIAGPDDLDGISELRNELGAGGLIEIDPPLRLRVEPEARRTLSIGADDLSLVGSPAPGFDRGTRTMLVRPPEITLIGPKSAVDDAWERRSELFERIVLDGQSRQVTQTVGLALQWRDRLRMAGAVGEDVPGLRVTLEFRRKMVAVAEPDGVFELPLQVVCNDDFLHRADQTRSWSDGWRLRFPGERAAPRRKVQFSAPAPLVEGPTIDRLKLELARDQVELVVRAHELAGTDRGTLEVAIVKFADFPEDLEVSLAPGEPSVVEVEWQPPAREGDVEGREKGGGNGD
ncbi:MAG: hypothetical protein EXS13_11860 [Planctomycetes bacterium]|nr:hypothetical protein [Planctomycetota bacterium]